MGFKQQKQLSFTADEATARGSECVSRCCATEQQEIQNFFFFFEVSLVLRTFSAITGRRIQTGPIGQVLPELSCLLMCTFMPIT